LLLRSSASAPSVVAIAISLLLLLFSFLSSLLIPLAAFLFPAIAITKTEKLSLSIDSCSWVKRYSTPSSDHRAINPSIFCNASFADYHRSSSSIVPFLSFYLITAGWLPIERHASEEEAIRKQRRRSLRLIVLETNRPPFLSISSDEDSNANESPTPARSTEPSPLREPTTAPWKSLFQQQRNDYREGENRSNRFDNDCH